MQREMEMEEEQDEDMEDIVPVMGSGDDITAAEDFAAEVEGGDLGAEIVELD